MKLENTDDSGKTLSISYDADSKQVRSLNETLSFLLSQTSTDNSVTRMEQTFIDAKASAGRWAIQKQDLGHRQREPKLIGKERETTITTTPL